MLEGQRVAVVVPAFEEELLVADTIRGIPDFVDRIVVVDDHSRDATAQRARDVGDPRVVVLEHEANGGVGAAILTGYRHCRDEGFDVTCVMAGDNQMDPAELEGLALPVARGEVDYAKANRLASGEAWTLIPRTRYLGNAVLSLLTKIASGLLARRRLAGRVHRALARGARAARPRPRLPPLWVPERHARPPQRPGRARPRRRLASHLRRRRALRDPHPRGRTAHLVAPVQGVLVADEGEVRDPRLPPAGVLLRARRAHDRSRARCSGSSSRCRGSSAGTTSPPPPSSSSRCCSSPARSSRCSRCGSTRRRTSTCGGEGLRGGASPALPEPPPCCTGPGWPWTWQCIRPVPGFSQAPRARRPREETVRPGPSARPAR